MAQKPIREATAKQLIAEHFQGAGKPSLRFVAVDPSTDLAALPNTEKWLQEGKIVAKVDEMFGKRGKLGYVKIAENYADARQWIEERRGTHAEVGNRSGALDHFILEPFIEHQSEYYLAFTCERTCDVVTYSDKGGIEVEDQGDSMVRIDVPLDAEPDLSPLPTEIRDTARGLFHLFRNLDLPYLEINPLSFVNGTTYLLDTVARVDTCSAYRQHHTWGSQEIPEGFGTTLTPEEKTVQSLDSKSGSSLKFVVLHPNGHVWTMVAGGGASIIYADDITAQINAEELANYGEWSGNPSTDEMEAYTNEILNLMTQNTGPQALIIGGGIANFTDIAKTFAGIIAVLRKRKDELKNVHIFVRRAGPRDREGLAALQHACDELGIPCITHGAELPMTDVVSMALTTLRLK